jgi:hypothetical protein
MGQPTTKQQTEKSGESRAPKREVEATAQLEAASGAELILDNVQAAAGAGAPPPQNPLLRKLHGPQRVAYVQRLSRKHGNGQVQRLLFPEPTIPRLDRLDNNPPTNGRIQRSDDDEVEITPEQKAAAKAAAAKAAAEAAATKTTGEQQQVESQQGAQAEQAEAVEPQQAVNQSLAEGPVSDAPLKAQEAGAKETQVEGEIKTEAQKEEVTAVVTAVEEQEKPPPASKTKPSANGQTAEAAESGAGGVGLEGATAAAQEAVDQSYASAEIAPDKAPTSPDQDPAHQSALASGREVGQTQQVHPDPHTSAAEAQVAAVQPPAEIAGLAEGAQVTEMEQAPTPGFNAAAFKAALMAKIAATTPQTAAQADDFKKSGKIDGARDAVSGTVGEEREASQKPLDEKREAAPDTGAIEPKETIPLQTNEPGPSTGKIGAEGAAPKKKGAGEVEAPVQGGAAALDQQMAEANLTEEQLENSNEPEFMTALAEKKSAQEAAVASLPAYRADEENQLAGAEAEAVATAEEKLNEMHSGRAATMTQVDGEQEQTKSADEQKRAEIAGQINQIYQATQAKVSGILDPLDGQVMALFDKGAAEAKTAFENYVSARMTAYKEERYGGWLGWARWAKDKLLSMPSEVNVFYAQGRELYIEKMYAVIDHIAALISTTLAEAQAAVAAGKQEIQDYIASLPEDLQEIGQEAGAAIADRFAELEQSIQDKQGELVDTLAQKYQENLQAIDARIEELKEANKGLVAKVIDAVGGVIDTVIQLKNMLFEVLASAAAAIDAILRDPIGFLGNLIDAVKLGFNNFVGNIEAHLKKGLMDWLLGAVAEAGIELPEQFDLPGIFSLVTQILGISADSILSKVSETLGIDILGAIDQVKELVGVYQEGGMAGLAKFGLEKIIGAEHMEQLMQVVQIVQTVREGGLTALWGLISDYLTDLKDTVMGKITEFISEKVIKAGITWLISLFNPAGAFIKACMMIVDLVKFFIENGSKIASLLQSIIGSIASIAAGNLTAAAKAIEEALAKVIPITISFLSSLLGLGNISGKVKEIITAIRGKVDVALNKILQSKPVQMVAGFIKKVIARVKAGATAVKEKAIETAKTAAQHARDKWDDRHKDREEEAKADDTEPKEGIPDLTDEAVLLEGDLNELLEKLGPERFLKDVCNSSWDIARNHFIANRLTPGSMRKLVDYREKDVGKNSLFVQKVRVSAQQYKQQEYKKLSEEFGLKLPDVPLVEFIAPGSDKLTSDIDYNIKGDGAEYAVEKFNANFIAQYGLESGVMFDVNAYTSDLVQDESGYIEGAPRGPLAKPELADYEAVNAYVAMIKYMSVSEWEAYKEKVLQAMPPGEARTQAQALFKQAEERYRNRINSMLRQLRESELDAGADLDAAKRKLDEVHHRRGEREIMASENREYEARLKKVEEERTYLRILQARLDRKRGEVEAHQEQGGEDLQKDVNDLEKQILDSRSRLNVRLNDALLFANEAYVSSGAISDVVGEGQLKRPAVNNKRQYLDSVNENMANAIKELNKFDKPGLVKPDKYARRMVDAAGKAVDDSFAQQHEPLVTRSVALKDRRDGGETVPGGDVTALKDDLAQCAAAAKIRVQQESTAED